MVSYLVGYTARTDIMPGNILYSIKSMVLYMIIICLTTFGRILDIFHLYLSVYVLR